MKIELDEHDVMVIMEALGDLPAKKSFKTILKLEQQFIIGKPKTNAENGETNAHTAKTATDNR